MTSKLFLVGMFFSATLSAQVDSLPLEPIASNDHTWTVSGYLKTLNTVAIPSIKGEWTFDNQIHNRIKFRYSPSPNLTFSVDLRNRLFFGESIKNNSLFIEQNTQINNPLKLGGVVFEEKSALLHSVFDRANLDFQKNDWQVTIGKQRVNWSSSYVWNPNDIFNAYSFFDFDYEERQGTDAILLRRYFGNNTSLELVSDFAKDWNKVTAAFLYKFNRKNTDYQVLAGQKDSTWVLGAAWAGQIKTAGFKGEMTYFQPKTGTSGTFIGNVSLDYALPNAMSFKFEAIVNTNPVNSDAFAFLTQPVSAKSLINNYFSVFGSIACEITPLIVANFNSIWNVDDGSFFLNPSFNFNLNDNTELLVAAQILEGKKIAYLMG
jgi:hypothetical protein